VQEKFDIVPMAALVLGAVSFIAPFAALKENRVVDGITLSGFELAGPAAGAASVIVALVIIVSSFLLRDGLTRRILYTAAGIGCFWITAVLLVRGGLMLGDGAAPRISPAIGFWGLPAASYILLDHSGAGRRNWQKWLIALVLLLPVALLVSGGRGESISVFQEWSARKSRFIDELIIHFRLFATAVLSAAILGIPMGILASRDKRIGGPVIAFVDAVQTIPSMALFGLLMAPLAAISRAFPLLRAMGIRGIGATPALIALTMYALLPIVRNTVTGLASVPPSALDAGRGMGMSPRQLFNQVEWPTALPHILTGLRTASVQAVGNTAVAALIGAGGLGIMIFQGLGQAAPDLILLGVLPLILMAVVVDRSWGIVIRKTVSPGLQSEGYNS